MRIWSICLKQILEIAVVVAQLEERSLWMPEVRGSIPVIGKLIYWTFICLLSTVLKRRKEKEADNGSFFKKRQFLE